MDNTSITTMTKLQSIVYEALLKAEDPNNLQNLFSILDETVDKLTEAFYIDAYYDTSQPKVTKNES